MSVLDNPFTSIYQMCELRLINRNQTVYDTLKELSDMFGTSDINNPIADKRIDKAKKFIADHFTNEMIESKDEAMQVHILRSMKQNLTDD